MSNSAEHDRDAAIRRYSHFTSDELASIIHGISNTILYSETSRFQTALFNQLNAVKKIAQQKGFSDEEIQAMEVEPKAPFSRDFLRSRKIVNLSDFQSKK